MSAFALTLAIFSSCGAAPDQRPPGIADFSSADRVHVQGNTLAQTQGDTRYITDPSQIHALFVLVASASGNWRQVGEQASVRWHVQFEREGKSLGTYSVGRHFLEIYPKMVALTPPEEDSAVRLLSTAPESTR
jgi:hypothetical protein